MATYTANYNLDLSTDAQYQALWGDVDTQLQGLGGWTYVAQTGDGDPATTATGAAGTYPCFRVYSTSVNGETWYMRLDFGHTAAGASLKMQVGSGVNGSGTLTGQTSTQATVSASASMGGAGKPAFLSQAAGRFMLYVGDPTQIRCISISVHGGVDGSGAMLSGMQVFGGGDASVFSQQIPVSGTVPVQRAYWPCNFGQEADTTTGGQVITGHPFLWDSAGGKNPTPAVAIGGSSNSTNGLTTTLTLYGGSHTYLSAILPFSVTFAGSSNNKPLYLYE